MRLKRIAVILVFLLSFASILAVSCQSPSTESTSVDDESSGQDVLKIIYQGKETLVEQQGLDELEVVEKELTITPKEDEEVTARKVKGYYLEDIFESFLEIDMKSLEAIRLSAKDGYSIEVTNDILNQSEIIIAFEVDGKPLEDWERPFRSAVSDVFEMYWVKNLVEIEVISGRVAAETDRLIFLETRAGQLESFDYEYYDSVDKAVSAGEFIIDFEDYNVSDHIYVMASDGLEKNEDVGIFRGNYIKYTGENAPAFVGDIPKGMWIKEIYYLSYGDASYFSVGTGLEVLGAQTVDGNESISLEEVFVVTGMKEKQTYKLEAADGYKVEIESEMLSSGYLFIDENGSVSIFFKDSPKKYSVKELLMIE